MDKETVTLVVAGLALVGTCIGAVLTRRSSREATQLDGWAKFAATQTAELSRVHDRLDQLEKQVQHEREQRHSLAEVLRLAWGHILRLGEQIRGLGGHPEPPPPDLQTWMHRDGVVVDRVETTISRTTVTNTHDHDPEQLTQYDVEIHEPVDTRDRH